MRKILVTILLVIIGLTLIPVNTFGSDASTSIGISPATKSLTLKPSHVYKDIFSITNNGEESINFEVYVTPYSYTKEEGSDDFKLSFTEETIHTLITKWITFKNKDGEYVETAEYTAKPHTTVDVHYRITTPESIPAGGQYAVLFARTLSSEINVNGVRTNASPGMILYAAADGKTAKYAEISDPKIHQGSKISATTVVKNYGNIDFTAFGIMEVKDIFGNTIYTSDANDSSILVLPDTEREVSYTWEETPGFGIFNVTWTTYADTKTETTVGFIVIISPTAIILAFLLLTIITIYVIMALRKRKEQ